MTEAEPSTEAAPAPKTTSAPAAESKAQPTSGGGASGGGGGKKKKVGPVFQRSGLASLLTIWVEKQEMK